MKKQEIFGIVKGNKVGKENCNMGIKKWGTLTSWKLKYVSLIFYVFFPLNLLKWYPSPLMKIAGFMVLFRASRVFKETTFERQPLDFRVLLDIK